MTPFVEMLLLFATALGAFGMIYEVLDGTNDPEDEDETDTNEEPTVEGLELGDRTVISGDDEDNSLSGTDDAERFEAGAGDDTITTGAGDNQVLAGDGNDTVTGSGTIFGEAGNDTLTANADDTVLVGGAGNDVLSATADATLFGSAGEDTLVAQGGSTMTGGADADLFVAASDDDDAGVLTVRDFVAGTDRLAFDLADGETVAGVDTASLDDEEDGLSVSVTITQADGTTRVEVVQLDDVTDTSVADDLQVRAADGTLSDLSTSNVITGTEDADTLAGGIGDDQINAGAGNDVVSGGLGENTVDLGAGDDSYTGGGNAETVQGGAGNDTITDVLPTSGDVGAVNFDGGEGDDVLTSVRADATLLGGAGNDTLSLGDAGGTANGGDGADIIRGGAGADTLMMDEADTVTGGAGEDLFILTADGDDADANATVITDFVEDVDVIRVIVPASDDVVTVVDQAGTDGATDAVIMVNGDPVAVVQGAGGLSVADVSVIVA